ncbi:hypothetical protein [Thiococcus pfennigii]|uniref:hypothetical protein n=1 Tax=Thiococcus pfennigii TaxID=1057 RepID=UPI001903623A|nr:hypothetical protein [Thiococcus pfennigii]
MRLMTMPLQAAVAATLGGTIAINTLFVAPALAGEWMPGDFHQHTYYTDGSYTFSEVTQSNEEFGLDWWANSEHGGSRNRDGNGENWDDPAVYPVNPILGDYRESGGHQVMWRWQSLRDFVYPDIKAARTMMPNKTIISGLEWNVPGHEHCSTAIHQYDDAATLISEFEYRYDKNDGDTSRNGQGSLLAGYAGLDKTNVTAEDAIAAVEFMQALKDQGLGDAWVVPAHIERANSYNIADYRNWNNAGPDVAFGFEGAPGHQTSGSRGFGTGSDGGGAYGGSGYYSAKVGGLWDALLGEGRNWWNFASSDYHNHWSTGGSDFWPGEYQKTYTYIDTSNPDPIQAVFDGVRSGASWHVMGDLIDKLEFTAYSGGKKAIMGETLEVRKGAWVLLKIKVRDPVGANHCPLDMNNPSLAQIGVQQPLNRPELDHIDLIGGKVTGYIEPPADFDGCPDVDTRDLETDIPYCKETNESTSVVKTFERPARPRFGYMTYFHWFKADEDMYFRLRGTNLPANVPFETDEYGNPLADSEAETNLYSMEGEELAGNLIGNIEDYVLNSKLGNATTSKLDEVAEAYADLWFYSNPIFIDVK